MDEYDRSQWFHRNANNIQAPRTLRGYLQKDFDFYVGDFLVRLAVVFVIVGTLFIIGYNVSP